MNLYNAYWDLDDHWGWTPYLGAGIGVAHNDIDDIYSTTTDFTTYGGSSWSFAWALMAGASTMISPDVLFDINYRYINFGDVRSATEGIDTDGNVVATTPIAVRNMDAHEVRLGFRYNFY